tara:strand:+ start:12317 stop:13171 length:855 start_codon:yes stop_codon:yes gene_type:complete
MKSLNNLIEDIYTNIQPICDGESLDLSEEQIDKFGEDMKNVLRHWSSPTTRDSNFTLRMSNIGKPMRQLWYDSKSKTDSSVTPITMIKFLYGHILEEVVLLLARLSGHQVSDEQKEITVNGVKGHMDCKIDGEVVDVKTASSFAFKKFKYGTLPDDDPFGYISQLSGYEQSEGTTEGGFLVINKETGELTFYAPDEFDKIDTSKRIKTIRKAFKSKTPPEKCYPEVPEGTKGNMKIHRGCSYCPHKFICHSDANDGQGLRGFRYAKGVTYFTKVVKEPNVEEVL